jgi:hypothetical protein
MSLGDNFVPGGQHRTLSPKAKVVPQGEVGKALLEGKLMEQRTPEELKRELQLIQDDLQSVKLQHARLTKAATHLGNAIQTLCKQELERFGCD